MRIYKQISATGSGGSGSVNLFKQDFLVGTWTGPVTGLYSITIPQSTHGQGLNPIIQLFENS